MRRRLGVIEQQTAIAGDAPGVFEMGAPEEHTGSVMEWMRGKVATGMGTAAAAMVIFGSTACGESPEHTATPAANASSSAEAKPTQSPQESVIEKFHEQLDANLKAEVKKYANDEINPHDMSDGQVALAIVEKLSDYAKLGATEANYRLWRQTSDGAVGAHLSDDEINQIPNLLEYGERVADQIAELTEDKGFFKDSQPETVKILNQLRKNNIICSFTAYQNGHQYNPTFKPVSMSRPANVENRLAMVKVEQQADSAACDNGRPDMNYEKTGILPNPAYVKVLFKRREHDGRESNTGTHVSVTAADIFGYSFIPTEPIDTDN